MDVVAEDEGYTDCKGALKGTKFKVLQKGDFIEALLFGFLEGLPRGNICELSRHIGKVGLILDAKLLHALTGLVNNQKLA